MVVIPDLSYAKGLGVDALAGTTLPLDDVALVGRFVEEIFHCEISRIANGYTWRSARGMAALA